MFRRVPPVLLAVVALLAPGHHVAAEPCWLPPVVGTVVDPFREPPCPYCAGNRGLEYRVGDDVPVRAVAAGTVSWAGTIAGTRYVVVRQAGDRRITYGELTSTHLSTGDRVVARSIVGRASGSFYLGLRVGSAYRDPAPFLGRLVGRPRLIPLDGTPPRPPPAPRVRCGA